MKPKTLRVHDTFHDALLDVWGFQGKLNEHNAHKNFRVYPWYSDEDGGWAVRIVDAKGTPDAVKKTEGELTCLSWE